MDTKLEQGTKRKPPRAGMGRPKGSLNKTTALLKDTILAAGEAAHEKGLLGYLTEQAGKNPVAFMTLVGKVLPMTVAGDEENPLHVVHRIERLIVNAKNTHD